MEESLDLALPDWRAWHRFSVLTDAPAVPSPIVTLHVDVTAIWMANWHKNGDARWVAGLQSLVSLFQAALCNKNHFFPIAPETWNFWCFFLTFDADPSVLDGYGSQRLVCICWGCPAGRLLEFALWPVGGVVGSAHRARLCGCAAVHLTKVGVGGGEGLEQQSSRTVSALNLKDCVKKPNKIWNFALTKCTVKRSSDYL